MEKSKRTLYTNLDTLDNSALEAIFFLLPLKAVCELALQSNRFARTCQEIWKHNSIYHDNLDHCYTPNDHGYKFYIWVNAIHFHSLRIYTSLFNSFNAVTENIVLHKLKNLSIIFDNEDYCNFCFPAAHFLKRCPNLEWLRISEAGIFAYMDVIVDIKSLKCLEVQHIDDVDSVVKNLIDHKGESLKRLQTAIDEFPPLWLDKHTLLKCNKLEELTLDTKQTYVKSLFTEEDIVNMPIIPSLKRLRILGKGVCLKLLKRFMMNCTELDTFISDNVHKYDKVVKEVLTLRSTLDIRTTLTLELSPDVIENIAVFDFE